MQCIELLAEIEARLDFDDELPPLDADMLVDKINDMWHDAQQALDTANYDKLLQSGLQVLHRICFPFVVVEPIYFPFISALMSRTIH